MHWPPGHPAVTDPLLARWAAGADEVLADGEAVAVLRHVPGRRVTSLVCHSDGFAVLKVFATPRARGNHRRLHALQHSPAAPVVPRPLGVDRSGHVLLLEHLPGTTLDRLDVEGVAGAARGAGAQLRVLHTSAVTLDRAWSLDDELRQLDRTFGPRSRQALSPVVGLLRPLVARTPVTSHRDCHPAQAVRDDGGEVRWADLDDAAMAPAGLDVGNFLAHVTRQEVLGAWSPSVAASVRTAFLDGYGLDPADLHAWELLARLRLAGLAETRHVNLDELRAWLGRLPSSVR